MKIYHPVRYSINQGFDSSPSMVEFYKSMGMSNHGGYDIGCPEGTPILWNCDLLGEVIYNEIDSAGGLGCSVLVKDEDRVFKFRFWHLSKFGSFTGEILKKGMVLGYSGNTGRSTGGHVHFDVKELIPSPTGKYLGMNDRYNQKFKDNGTFGSIRIDEWLQKNVYVFDDLSVNEKIRSVLISIIKNIIYK